MFRLGIEADPEPVVSELAVSIRTMPSGSRSTNSPLNARASTARFIDQGDDGKERKRSYRYTIALTINTSRARG